MASLLFIGTGWLAGWLCSHPSAQTHSLRPTRPASRVNIEVPFCLANLMILIIIITRAVRVDMPAIHHEIQPTIIMCARLSLVCNRSALSSAGKRSTGRGFLVLLAALCAGRRASSRPCSLGAAREGKIIISIIHGTGQAGEHAPPLPSTCERVRGAWISCGAESQLLPVSG